MIRAAGILFITPDKEALFLRRGPGSDHALQWAPCGGQQEDGETLEECAIRECEEETGVTVKPGQATLLARTIVKAEEPPPTDPVSQQPIQSEDVDFSTYLVKVKEPFTPHQCDEHVGWSWAKLAYPPEPLHPGARIALARLTANELDIARMMAAGELTSPQVYENVHLWNIRITSTGVAYRQALQEFVFRKPENYLTEEFCQRCNGLSVIWEHPPGATMSSEEFGNRVVGSIMLAYIKGQDVWGIAKVYDAAMNKVLFEEEASTSPTVVFRDPAANTKMTLEDGKTLLIEGVPALLDHIAILPNKGAGVWDKLGDPVGVDRSGVDDETRADSQKPFLQDLAARLDATNTRLTTLAIRKTLIGA